MSFNGYKRVSLSDRVGASARIRRALRGSGAAGGVADEPLEPRSSKGEGGKLGHEFEPPSSSGHLKVCMRLVGCRIWPWRFESHGVKSRPERGAHTPSFIWGQDQPRGGERVSYFRLRLAIVVGALLALAGSTSGLAASDGVVISQVYGGGGNAGASFTHDFIELFNRGTTPVVLDGMSVQYASATGTGLSAHADTAHGALRHDPARQVPPHPRGLERRGRRTSAGNRHRRRDADRDGRRRGQGRAGTGTTTLGCNTAATCTAAGTLGRIVDLVGYGNATSSRGRPQLRLSTPPRRPPGPAAAARRPTTTRPTSPRSRRLLLATPRRRHSSAAERPRRLPRPPSVLRPRFGSGRREHAPHRRCHAGREPDEHRYHRHR